MSDLTAELLAAVERCRATTIEIDGVTWPYSPGDLILYIHPDDLAELKATSFYYVETPNIMATLMGVPFRENSFVPRGKVITAPSDEEVDRVWARANALLIRHGIEVSRG